MLTSYRLKEMDDNQRSWINMQSSSPITETATKIKLGKTSKIEKK